MNNCRTFIRTNTEPGGTGQQVRFCGYEVWKIGEDGLIAESLGHSIVPSTNVRWNAAWRSPDKTRPQLDFTRGAILAATPMKKPVFRKSLKSLTRHSAKLRAQILTML